MNCLIGYFLFVKIESLLFGEPLVLLSFPGTFPGNHPGRLSENPFPKSLSGETFRKAIMNRILKMESISSKGMKGIFFW